MDCNKDEAHRAMELAGKKMQLRDFTSARKLIFKAQKLHNELENISQMLTVCDVHCAAAIKINGSEDWYNILQVQPMSDDPTIKKQYRKLALLLHPDKNKFAGSESAFKIIGEAHRTLSDPTKRAVYNMKRNTISNSTSTTTTNRPQFNRPNTNVFTRMNLNPNNNIFPKPNIQSTPQPSFGLPIFFTKCCHCGSQYKYPQNMMFRNIVCQNCEKSFAAIDLKKTQEVNSKVGGNDGAIDHEKKKTMAFNVTKVKLSAVNIESSLKDKSKGPNKSTKFNHGEISKDTLQTVKISQNPKRKIIDNEVNKKEKSISPSKFIKTKHVEVAETNSSRETLLHDISNYPDSEFFDFEMKRNDSVFAVNDIWSLYDDIDEMPRFYAIINKVRMENFKVWYTWLELTPSTPAERNWCDNDLPAACGNFHFGVSQTSTDLRMFSNIMSPQKESTKTHFVIHPNKGDIWALYKGWKKDTDWTQNPRNLKTPFDFEIVEVLSDFNEDGICVAVMIKVEKFVSLFTRLVVNDADVVIQIRPDEMLRFSHMVSSYRLTGKERDGSIPEGFFELDLASLPLSLIHVFPSISLEVAVAAQAKKISVLNSDTTYGANKKATKKKKMNSQIPSSTKNLKPQNSDAPAEAIQNFTPAQRTKPPFGNSDMNAINIPKTTSPLSPSEHSDFHNFQEEKFCYRFEGGQIWALYSDLDTFPKDLVLITNVTLDRCKILDASVIMLKPCPILNVHKKWFNKKLPFGCGKFNLVSSPGCGRLNTSGTIAVKPEKFSHHMRRAEVSKTISHYYIYPCAGEVWAIYRNWNIDWEVSDLVSCEYDIIEVISSSSRCIRGLVLVKVEGYNTVFMHQKGDCSSGDSLKMNNCVEIIQQDYLRFSHRVPAFRLTKVHGEFLQGCFSLDPRSIPQGLLCDRD
ncbi:hypothetical protein ZOSMA_12G00210 [Zostera marina]|uniref:J domain-containing protein n=1 Tax=Zostera marina TaxID=29655 RepID=A0A0K9Q1D7_ZOSMR|nr:hypothetical protein ZOSMA_12G00210 [Zostera marina]